jgi:metallo-beta-lactamase family protein
VLFPAITHHGAHEGVTGSCHQVHLSEGLSLLIDCGLFQGAEARGQGPDIDFPLDGITALVVTHVHLDHIGRIPWLLAAGFDGPILCSEPSAQLLPLMLEDAFKLMLSRDQAKLERFLTLVNSRIIALPYGQWFPVAQQQTQCHLRLQRAGHVLGSAYVEIDIPQPGRLPSKRVVFSGDLGSGHSALLRAPVPPERADLLVLESTYGDRLHGNTGARTGRLELLIEQALQDQGTILIPSFSLGRTQELLADIETLLRSKTLDTLAGSVEPIDWPQLPVILDSPLASRITQAYRALQPYWNDEAQARAENGQSPLRFPQLITIDSHAQHQRTVNYLASTLRPAIVIAGNGMCSAGRIVNYLKAMLRHPRHNVLFSGYQAKGTPGALIQAAEGAEGFVGIDLDGERYDIRAGVATLEGYSAHADQAGLIAFVEGMQEPPGEVKLVHGEARAKRVLAKALNAVYPSLRVITR